MVDVQTYAAAGMSSRSAACLRKAIIGGVVDPANETVGPIRRPRRVVEDNVQNDLDAGFMNARTVRRKILDVAAAR